VLVSGIKKKISKKSSLLDFVFCYLNWESLLKKHLGLLFKFNVHVTNVALFQTYFDQHPEEVLSANRFSDTPLMDSISAKPGAPILAGHQNALLQKPNSEMRPLHLRFTLESSVKYIAQTCSLLLLVRPLFFCSKRCTCVRAASVSTRGPFIYDWLSMSAEINNICMRVNTHRADVRSE
jgi:hypothetical protein